MKKFIAAILLSLVFIVAYSQSCLPDGITFETQAQIDSFQINYPGCTEIEGWVIIGTSVPFPVIFNIYNLNGLSALTSIGGSLGILYVYSISSLTGLENLHSVGGGLSIVQNNNLSSISALENITSIGGELHIVDNPSLISLSGLNNIESGSMNYLGIWGNDLLSTCEVESVCAYLSNPGGDIDINGNAPGCNSPEEVKDSCEANAVNIDEQYIKDNLIIYPNPAIHVLNIAVEGQTIDEVTIYTLTGQKVYVIKSEGENIDVSTLQSGMYIVEVTVEGRKVRRKLVVE